MTHERKEGSGVLFKNDRKEKENQPDYTGSCLLNGKEMRISAWIKTGKSGKFMSLSIQPKDAAPQKREERRYSREDDPAIPF